MICASCQTEAASGLTCECGQTHCSSCYDAHPCKGRLWPWNQRGTEECRQAIQQGYTAIVYTSPTGGGKTSAMTYMAKSAAKKGKRATILTNRRILTGQTSRVMDGESLSHGVIAVGHDLDLLKKVQLARIQTINSRVYEQEKFILPPSDLVLVDEGHSRAYDRIVEDYKSKGAVVVMFTATPVNLPKGMYSRLVIAGTKAELRQYGALVPCSVFAPSEPDMKGVKRNAIGEYTKDGMRKRVMQTIVFADVFKEWKERNPWASQTILFAPGVAESMWFAEQFTAMGVTAGHIDAETPENEREDLIQGSKEGRVKVLTSFGVLREGFDAPWLEYGILVQVCGALSTYLQVVGRILRACPETGKKSAILQDHSGAWHRHGSPNEDHAWNLDDTDLKLAKARKQAIQKGDKNEGICCPKCHGIRSSGPKCPHCGYEHVKSSRVVVMEDGTLKKMLGSVTKRKRQVSEDQKKWNGCLYAAGNSKRVKTLASVRGDYFRRYGAFPPVGLMNMPPEGSLQWMQPVTEVYPFLVRRKKAAQ